MSVRGPSRRSLVLGGLGALAGCSTSGIGESVPTRTPPPRSDPTPGPPATRTAPEWRTRAMTYNVLTSIRTGADWDPAVDPDEVRLGNRVPVMARWITTADPDVIGVQENEASRASELPLRALAPLLPGYRTVLPELEVSFLVKTAAYSVDDADSKLLSKRFYRRYLAWCWLTHLDSGGRVLVANTHLDPYQRSPQARARSAEVDSVIAELGRLNPGWRTPQLLLGDFNTRSDETRRVYRDALVKLPRAGLRNSERIAARDISEVPNAASKNDFGVEIGGRFRYRAIRTDGMCYDYVFVSHQVKVRSWQVVTGPGVRRIKGRPYFADGPVPSDHCPVQVDVTVRN